MKGLFQCPLPLVGDRNLRRKDVTALRCSEPLRSKVGGASKPCAILCGMGPPGERCFLQGYQFKWSFEDALADWFEDNDRQGLK